MHSLPVAYRSERLLKYKNNLLRIVNTVRFLIMKIIWEDNGHAFDQAPVVEALESEVEEAAEAAEVQEAKEEAQFFPPASGFGW